MRCEIGIARCSEVVDGVPVFWWELPHCVDTDWPVFHTVGRDEEVRGAADARGTQLRFLWPHMEREAIESATGEHDRRREGHDDSHPDGLG